MFYNFLLLYQSYFVDLAICTIKIMALCLRILEGLNKFDSTLFLM